MKSIATTYHFESESSSKTYQTLQYTDGTVSCDCFGWTKRVQKDGTRQCKHTRWVVAGLGNRHAIRVVETNTVATRTPQKPMPEATLERSRRVFELEEKS